MREMDLLAMIELAKLRNREPKKYKKILSSIKEVFKDIAKLELEIIEEVEIDMKEKKKKEKEELDLRIAEKMKRDK